MLEGPGELHLIQFPAGTTAVVMRTGYLLVDNAAHRFVRVATRCAAHTDRGRQRAATAIAGDLVVWTDNAPLGMHIADLATTHTIDIPTSFDAVSARFSPDRSRLAILSGGLAEAMVLVDTSSGKLLAEVSTASGGNALATYGDIPAVFQPVPFGGMLRRLVLIAQTTVGYFAKTIDTATGAVLRTVAAPKA